MSFRARCINGKVLPVDHKPPTAVIESAHGEHALPWDDTTDFDNADRGFIASLSPCVIKAADGRVVWDNDVYAFLDGPAPTSVHPSLWRQSGLNAKQGLYEVVPGIYQVRGFDLSNISFIEGDAGIIVIDPLVSTEVAAAALDFYRAHRGGDRPVVAVIYTHSHVDHFGGVLGVTSQADVDAGKVAVLAPEGLHRACRAGERLRRTRDDPAGNLYVRHPAGARTPGAGWLRAWPGPIHRRGRHHRPDHRHPGDRRKAHDRRCGDRVSDGARHRGSRRNAFLFSTFPRVVHGRECHPQSAQPAHLARRPGPRPARLGGLSHRSDRHFRRAFRCRVRVPSLADLGARQHRRVSCRCSATCMPTCTTRHCGCSTRATPAWRSPKCSRCHPLWTKRGIRTVTTGRSATTSRPSTSVTWAGSTAIPAGCGRIRRRPWRPVMSRRWAGSIASSSLPKRHSTPVISVGPRRYSIMRSSPTVITPRPARCMRTPWSNWATAPRMRRGATSS